MEKKDRPVDRGAGGPHPPAADAVPVDGFQRDAVGDRRFGDQRVKGFALIAGRILEQLVDLGKDSLLDFTFVVGQNVQGLNEGRLVVLVMELTSEFEAGLPSLV